MKKEELGPEFKKKFNFDKEVTGKSRVLQNRESRRYTNINAEQKN